MRRRTLSFARLLFGNLLAVSDPLFYIGGIRSAGDLTDVLRQL